MEEQRVILGRLLDKYENSKHILEPGISLRRVMLRVLKKELPEYDYEDAAVRDSYNAGAQELERQRLVQLEWLQGRPVLSAIILNLEQATRCYELTGRIHPKAHAAHIAALVSSNLSGVSTPWIKTWRSDVCAEAYERMRVPSICKDGEQLIHDLCLALREYDVLPSSVTMRAFSSKCFQDTKYFERNVRDTFLRIARKYNTELVLACEEGELSERDQLAFLGIYARPELYELAGNITVRMKGGYLLVGAATPYGLALPSTLVESIVGIDLQNIRCVTFIENKTNYDEYLVSEQQMEELVVYHGGFLSPQKKRLFALVAAAASENIQMRFWADIDLGGFQMFAHLQKLIPSLLPMRMSSDDIKRYHQNGLMRSEKYLSRLRMELQGGKHVLFTDPITQILKYGVTIEQEIFLN